MQKFIHFSLFLFILISSSCLLIPKITHADTIINSDISTDTSWTKNKSPYVITSSITIASSTTLTIDPGVTVKFINSSLTVLGTLNALGTDLKNIILTSGQSTPSPKDPWGINIVQKANANLSYVTISDMGKGLNVQNSSLIGTYVNFVNSNGIQIYAESSLSLASSTFTSSNNPLTIFASTTATIHDSHFLDTLGSAITVYGSSEISLENSEITNSSQNGILAFQDAQVFVSSSTISHNQTGILLYQNPIGVIASSSITDNTFMGANAYNPVAVQVINDWWGSDSGPYNEITNPIGTGNSVSENINFAPWITQTPITKPTCCSNVVFIPGIEASRLYLDNSRLWEPFIDNDFKNYTSKLEMDETGKSINPIVTNDIINDGGFGHDIYKDFIVSMDNLVSSKAINSWEPLPYDWRMDVNDVATQDVKLQNGKNYNMIAELERMASTSSTGKVTIIAHSDGGLVTKALIKNLVDSGRTDLLQKIDKVIMVAVPNFGTPMVIPGLLHGYGQSYGYEVVLSESQARQLGSNMPGTYGLLPSKAYFSLVADPVISFDSNISNSTGFKSYGNNITDSSTLIKFLTALKDHRSQPTIKDIRDPSVLNPSILQKETKLHDSLDNFIFPSNIQLTQIAGWGKDTIKGFNYKTISPCLIKLICLDPDQLDETPIYGNGDGTVLLPSATALTANTYYFDLNSYNNKNNKNRSHSDILEIPDIDITLNNLIQNRDIQNTPFLSTNLPSTSKKSLQISIHSPATIDLYDSQGNHTGLIGTSTDDDIQQIDEQIPNSYYMNFGEGKYIGIDGDASTTLNIQGTGIGTFTLDIDTIQNGTMANQIEFADVPVTPATTAQLVSSTTSTSSTPQLAIDEDGDGTADYTIQPDQPFDAVLYLQTMEKTIIAMQLNTKIEQQLIKKLDKMILLVQQDKTKQVLKRIQNLIKNIDYKKRLNKMTDSEKQGFVNTLSDLLDNLNKNS